MSAELTILCYHRVLPESARNGDGRPYFVRGTAVSITDFRAQVASLASRFELVGEDDVIAWLAGQRSFARPACWLTFDDGYVDVLQHAAPILAELGAPATAFIATDVLEGAALPADRWYAVLNAATRRRGTLAAGESAWAFDLDVPSDYARLIDGPEKRAYLAAPPAEREPMLQHLADAVGAPCRPGLSELYLSRESLARLVAAGWSIGSHTRSHPFLPLLSDRAVDDELRDSRGALASLGVEARSFAYPDGRWTAGLVTRVRSAGYALGLTLDPGSARVGDEPLALPRSLGRAPCSVSP